MIGSREGAHDFAAMNLLSCRGRKLFISDTYVNLDPTPEQLAEMAVLAAAEIGGSG